MTYIRSFRKKHFRTDGRLQVLIPSVSLFLLSQLSLAGRFDFFYSLLSLLSFLSARRASSLLQNFTVSPKGTDTS